jgi:hypothetical protein
MEKQKSRHELRLEVIKFYEEEIEYLKKNLLKKTKYGTWITPRLIQMMKIRLYELKTGKKVTLVPVVS